MMSCDVCDGLELVRRPYNGRDNMNSAVRAPLAVAVPMRLFVTETVTVTQVSLLYRSTSFVHVASTAGTAIDKDIKNRAGCANKRPYHSLVTFSLWDQPNVRRKSGVSKVGGGRNIRLDAAALERRVYDTGAAECLLASDG